MFRSTTKSVIDSFDTPKKKESKYVFFWKINGPNGIFSQWFQAPMVINGIQFANCEQYMMYQKALLFEDHKIAEACLATDNPKTIKALGRKIANFDEKIWVANRYKIVLEGNRHKFNQNPQLLKELLKHKGKIIVEASPNDRIWGIGYIAAFARVNEKKWGLNLLGKALTQLSNVLVLVLDETTEQKESLFDLEPCTHCPEILTKPKRQTKCTKSIDELLN